MGLSQQSTGGNILRGEDGLYGRRPNERVIALAGNPNVGKSTLFNALTGLQQHTGNWPGKTVMGAEGRYTSSGGDYLVIDLPGAYSLMATSVEEEVARDLLCFGGADLTVVVVDATCLERNLNLVLQTLEITDRTVICVNLLDEARRKGIEVDLDSLSDRLGVPVVGTSASTGDGLDRLKQIIDEECNCPIPHRAIQIDYGPVIERAIQILSDTLTGDYPLSTRWLALRLLEGNPQLLQTLREHLGEEWDTHPETRHALEEASRLLTLSGVGGERLRDKIVSQVVASAEQLASQVTSHPTMGIDRDRRIDRVLLSKRFGIPIMAAMLVVILWLTIEGANIPSSLLSSGFSWLEGMLAEALAAIGITGWLHNLLVVGVFRTLGWIVSVMLPPMAIFFPLFTLLEDVGILPRIAFNLDHHFQCAGACGKQALTMCMGFGCNAAGVIGCRIIDSPRERLIAMLTNAFVPCNGRFPTLILLIGLLGLSGWIGGLASALLLTVLILLGIAMTLVASKLLASTVLKGMPSTFALELPPYRKPQVGKILVRSIFDRTLFVLARAVMVAIPAGILIWLCANVIIGDASLLSHITHFLDPLGRLMGLDGVLLAAFILGFPANEIVLPIALMGYLATGSMVDLESVSEIGSILLANGWSIVTIVCSMIFTLFHFPCATTCLTLYRENGSIRWTLLAFLLPTLIGVSLCIGVAFVLRIFGL